jgi:hypothetical protein
MSTNDFQYENRFKVVFGSKDLDDLDRGIVNVSLPNVSIGFATQPTHIRDIYVPGDSVGVSDIVMTFVLDRDYSNLVEVLNWMDRLRNFDEATMERDVIDVAIVLLDSKYRVAFELNCKDCFPTNVSDILFNQQISDVEPVRFAVTFKVNGIEWTTP